MTRAEKPAPWTPRDVPDLTGRAFAVTGGNAGIGYFVCEHLAGAGARVVLLARDPGRADAAAASLRERAPGADVVTVPLDLADLESVASAATALTRLDRLDGLVHNAAVVHPGRVRRTTRQGFELAVGTNHLGHFALTALAWPALAATPGSRVVPVGSVITRRTGFGPGDVEDLMSERSYRGKRAYARSKHAAQSFGFELDRRLRAAGADVHAVVAHPGLGLDAASPFRAGVNEPSPAARAGARLLAPVAQGKHRGAWAAVRAATDPEAVGGRYYGPARGGTGLPVAKRPPTADTDPLGGARLWALSERLTGITFPLPPRLP
ncbi:SDR family NAD(P)-dependent oxidoreductase [Streptomyces radicis]|uniref:SDR family NAD(P)-dependent oxidoreductase n=1 Tax=Streptomyces radicis TaxID=1750517 RepID=A0A3A9WN33_9ACTN|nr:SDR family NAD(P)-dependent oxidoreductase [Streptomyces radicis]RKN10874.1 SDR family NAD(P)-dependent oxidoreductase [Streptomyces radicis]RKN25138.1 SDR family NAD(P)-dependent oxidoreductase [Streptomyces radicis]